MRRMILTSASLLSILAFAGEGLAQAQPARTRSATPTAATPVKAAVVARADQVVCRKDTVTGSRVRKTKTCLTQREWDRLSKRGESVSDELGRERENTVNPRPAG